MNFDDPRWNGLLGGYRIPYDPRPALRALADRRDVKAAWDELWQDLHHQGDVGEASYAAVPALVQICSDSGLVEWSTFALPAIIEEARHSGRNPAMPSWLKPSYDRAWKQLLEIALRELLNAEDPDLIQATVAVAAIGKGQISLGRLAIMFTEDERQEMLTQTGWA